MGIHYRHKNILVPIQRGSAVTAKVMKNKCFILIAVVAAAAIAVPAADPPNSGGGELGSASSVFTVIANNTRPSLSGITNVHTVMSTAFAPATFTVADAEDSPEVLLVSATSSDEALIPDANLVLSGSGANRTLNVTPNPDVIGNAIITLTVSDSGGLRASTNFNAMILRSSAIILSEPFDYADGPLTINSARLWTTRTGTLNQMETLFSTALLTGNQTENVAARLIGGPYPANSQTVLYASFNVVFIGLPGNPPDVFAHFCGTDPNNLQGQILATTANVTPGYFRLGVGDTTSAENDIFYPTDLSLDTWHQVIVSYDLAIGTSRLWVDPASGAGPVTANDASQPTAIGYFGLRQSERIGDMRMDNLLVGFSFEDVTPNLTRVHIRRAGNAVQVYWPSGGVWAGFILEGTPSLENPDWQPVNESVVPTAGWDVVTIEGPSENRFFRLKNSF